MTRCRSAYDGRAGTVFAKDVLNVNVIGVTISTQAFLLLVQGITNSSDTSTTKATQPDDAIPAAKIAALSSGEFVGIVADNPDQKI